MPLFFSTFLSVLLFADSLLGLVLLRHAYSLPGAVHCLFRRGFVYTREDALRLHALTETFMSMNNMSYE